MRLGLRGQILISVSMLMVATMFLVSLAMLGLIQHNMERQAEHTAERVARIAASTMASSIAPGETLESPRNRANLGRLCALFSGQFSAARMMVASHDPEGQNTVIAAYPVGGYASLDIEFRVAEVADRVIVGLGDGEDGVRQVEVFAPIRLDGEVIAVLRLEQPLAELQRLVSVSQQLMLLYIVLDAILIIVLGYFALTRMIVRPVIAISAATERVAAGDFGSSVEVNARNELGELAGNFDRMVARLRAGRDALEAQLDEVQRSKSAVEQAQKEVLFSEKMATVGGLAAGVAHEIGNPLAAVMGLIDLLSDDDGSDPEQRRDLFARADRELHRINGIIGELLDYARVSDGGAESLPIAAPISTAVTLCGHHPKGRHVTIAVPPNDASPEVFANDSRLVQVFLNLLLNAADAAPNGDIEIRWREVDSEGEAGVQVDVRDEGPGFGGEDPSTLFEPFFTTKGPGEGTGLGLAICARIVTQYRGRIWASEGADGGAVFTVWLPRAEQGQTLPSGK